jgi:hypothetical protein
VELLSLEEGPQVIYCQASPSQKNFKKVVGRKIRSYLSVADAALKKSSFPHRGIVSGRSPVVV